MSSKPPPINIGEVIYRATIFNHHSRSNINMDSTNLPQVVKKLFDLLHERKVPYLLVGGIALLQYIEGRNTEDIDLIMAHASLRELPEIKIHDQNMYFAHGTFDVLQIDLLLTENPLFKKIQEEYATSQ